MGKNRNQENLKGRGIKERGGKKIGRKKIKFYVNEFYIQSYEGNDGFGTTGGWEEGFGGKLLGKKEFYWPPGPQGKKKAG